MNLRSNKAVTLIAVVLTLVMMVILFVAISNNNNVKKVSESDTFYKTRQDIISLSKAVQSYYLKHGEIPVISTENNTDFRNTISAIGADSNDRNPNDNDIYYTLYEPGQAYEENLRNKLPEVTLMNPENTYVVNQGSLTVYCVQGYWLDDQQHFTASEMTNGGLFANEYYLGVSLYRDGDIEIKSNTEINVDGVNKTTGFEHYANAEAGGQVILKIFLKDGIIKDTNGNSVKDFNAFAQKPTVNSFTMKVMSLDGQTTYNTVNASSISIHTGSNELDNYCAWTFDTAQAYNSLNSGVKDGTVRFYLEFDYNSSATFYYNNTNVIDYSNKIKMYQRSNRMQLEQTKEEVLIASEMDKIYKVSKLTENLDRLSTPNAGGAPTLWSHLDIYETVIIAPSGKRYIVTQDLVIYKGNTLTINVTSDQNAKITEDCKFYSNSVLLSPSNNTKSITVIKGTTLNVNVSAPGHVSGTINNVLVNSDITRNIELTAIQYTFTLKSNTGGSTLSLSNQNRIGVFSATGDENSSQRSISAYVGDNIKYNVKKDWYRMPGRVGLNPDDQITEMPADNVFKDITLEKNILTGTFREVYDHTININLSVGLWDTTSTDADHISLYAKKTESKTSQWTYTIPNYSNVLSYQLVIGEYRNYTGEMYGRAYLYVDYNDNRVVVPKIDGGNWVDTFVQMRLGGTWRYTADCSGGTYPPNNSFNGLQCTVKASISVPDREWYQNPLVATEVVFYKPYWVIKYAVK